MNVKIQGGGGGTYANTGSCTTIRIINKMINYKDLGLVNTREMFAKAIKGGYYTCQFIYFENGKGKSYPFLYTGGLTGTACRHLHTADMRMA